MLAKNSWQLLLCIVIQVFMTFGKELTTDGQLVTSELKVFQMSTAAVPYYSMSGYSLYPMNMREQQNAPLLVPAPAENIAQILPVDTETPLTEKLPPLPLPVSVENLTSPLEVPELIPPGLSNISSGNLVSEILKNPSKGIAAFAEDMSSFLRDRLPGNAFAANPGEPFDFTVFIDGLRKTIDTMGQNKECQNGLTVIDHSLYASKELISAINALQKLREMWKNTDVNSILQCFISPALLQSGINLSPIKPDDIKLP